MIKFASHHFLLYVVYMCQKSLNLTYALKCYHQKCSWPHFSWPTLYIIQFMSFAQGAVWSLWPTEITSNHNPNPNPKFLTLILGRLPRPRPWLSSYMILTQTQTCTKGLHYRHTADTCTTANTHVYTQTTQLSFKNVFMKAHKQGVTKNQIKSNLFFSSMK